MKRESLTPVDDLMRVWVCTVCDMMKKGVAPPTHSRFAEKTKFHQVSVKRYGFDVWEWREQLMEMERKMAMNQDGKLVKAAPFDSYSLRYFKKSSDEKATKRLPLRYTDSGMLKVRKDGKTKENPLPFQ